MAVDKEVRGPLWVDGQLTVRVRGPGPEPGRVIRVRRPFALIGQLPGADIRIDDPAIDGRHAFLLLDRRGVFGVDLMTRTGTRFAELATGSAWLGAGDILEIAGRRVELLQLRIDGCPIDPPLSDSDLLSGSEISELVDLTLEPLDPPGSPWRLGSALAFVGRGEACAIRIDNASASITHCALLRGPSTAYVIDLLGRLTLINDRPVEGASALLNGDILTIGQSRFAIQIDRPSSTTRPSGDLPTVIVEPASTMIEPYQGSQELVVRPPQTMIAMLIGAAEPGRESSRYEFLDMIRQFQADTAAMFEAQVERIEALNREIALLKEEIQGTRQPPEPTALPLRLELKPPQGTPSEDSAAWLLDRLNTLETETRSTWKDLLGRITSTAGPRPNPNPRLSLAPNRPKPPSDKKS
jgi:pSer/pThr/pTyr-binding forkhead associated (FHA) protein